MDYKPLLLKIIEKEELFFPKTFDWDKFYSCLKLNELEIFFYKNYIKKDNPFPSSFLNNFKNDVNEHNKFSKGLDFFLRLMKESGFLRYSLIKLKFLEKTHSDIDLFTTKKDVIYLKNLLQKKGFEIKDDLGYEISMRKKYLGRDLVIDLHSDITYNNEHFLDVKNILKKKQDFVYQDMKIKYSSFEDDFIITLVHSFFQKVAVRRIPGFNLFKWSEITLSDIYQLKKSSENKSFDWDYVKKTAREYGWERALSYYLIILDKYFPDKKTRNILKELPKIGVKDTQDIEKTPFPIYTPILLNYKIYFYKLIHTPWNQKIPCFFRMHKWFLVNLLRIIYHKLR